MKQKKLQKGILPEELKKEQVNYPLQTRSDGNSPPYFYLNSSATLSVAVDASQPNSDSILRKARNVRKWGSPSQVWQELSLM